MECLALHSALAAGHQPGTSQAVPAPGVPGFVPRTGACKPTGPPYTPAALSASIQVDVHAVTYQLCSVILHRGKPPNSGRYVNLLYDVRDGSYRLADDGVLSSLIDGEFDNLAREIYLFWYIRCG